MFQSTDKIQGDGQKLMIWFEKMTEDETPGVAQAVRLFEHQCPSGVEGWRG